MGSSTSIEIRLLGAFALILDGTERRIGSAKQRQLLAVLAVNRDRVVPLETIAEALWGDRRPASVPGSVASLVSRLRRQLAPAHEARLTQTAGGYRFEIDAVMVDGGRFEDLVRRAREAASDGQPGTAAPLYQAALALWRGPAMSDLIDADFARLEATRLERLRAEAVEELAEAELAVGSPATALALLEPHVAADPLRERAWAGLMLALYRLGRQAEALRAYQDLRSRLGEELGLEPTPALRTLERQILKQSPELDWTGRGQDVEYPPPGAVPGGHGHPSPGVTPVPLPPLLGRVGRIFVGRDTQLQRCVDAWKAAGAGDRRTVLVGGEPGIGKTRLAAEVAAVVAADGGLVLGGRCDEDLGVPYQPFVEALRHYVTYAGAVRPGRHGGELARLVPDITDRVRGLAEPLRSDPETERYRLFDAVAGWLAAVSADAPALLLLDDLQWAAKPTLLLLRHVVRSAEPMRLLVLATYRDTDVGRRHPLAELLADLRGDVGVDRIPLTGLDRSGVAAYIEAAAGHDRGDEGFARAVWEETEGNPFFVAEVVRHLTESGAVVQREGRWEVASPLADLGIPEGVRDVVGRRLSRLPDTANRVLAVGSVAGLQFEPAVVARAGGFTDEDVIGALEQAMASRLLSEVTGTVAQYRFAHALVRATLYDELSAARRVTLHRQLGEAIEAVHAGDLEDHLPALAHHWARAAAPAADAVRAVDYATRAGDRALTQLAHDEAVTYYQQALDLLRVASDDSRRLELLISLGEAQRRAGTPDHRETLLAAAHLARQRNDAGALARAVLANQRGFVSVVGAIDRDRVDALEAAVAAVGPAHSPVRARLLALLANELHFCGDDRPIRLCREALATARAAGDTAALAQVLATAGYVTWGVAPPGERVAMAAELAGLAERLGDPMVGFGAAVAGYYAACEQPDLEVAERRLSEMVRLAGEIGQPVLRWRTTYMAGVHASAIGRFDESTRLAEESLRLGEAAGQPDAFAHSRGPLSIAELVQGRAEAAAAIQRDLLVRFPGITTFRALLAWSSAEAGNRDESVGHVVAVRAGGFDTLPRDYTWAMTLGFLSHAVAILGEEGWAAELYQLLREAGPLIILGATVWIGPASHSLGLLATTLGRHDEADRHFAHAASTQERVGARGMLIHTQLAWARMLLARNEPGDDGRAATLVAAAGATAHDLGYPELERRAAELSR